MQKRRGHSQERKQVGSAGMPAFASRGTLVTLILLSWLSLAGCSSDNRAKTNTGDPLFGASTSAPAAPTPAIPVSRTNNPSAATGPLPPPVPSSSTSPAALAAGGSRPFDRSQDLRIGAPGPAPTPSSQYGKGTWNSAVELKQPLPTNPSGGVPAPAFTTSSRGGRIGSYEQAQSVLSGRGVSWQRLETWGNTGEWKFSCSIPNRQNPYISRNYEARARDFLSAIHAVLEQMDREK